MRGVRRVVALPLFASGLLWTGLERPEAVEAGGNSEGPSGLELVVNLPAYRLDVYEGGRLIRSYPVAIGKPSHRTPRGVYRITHVDWNPWWHPPDRPWARGARETPPGPRNPMGRAKLYFRDLYYLHGTPAKNSLGSAASHGCVRMRNEDVVELARLVHAHGSPGISRGVLDRLEANPRQTRTIRVTVPVRLELVYELAEVREGRLELHPDVYALGNRGLRERAIQALMRAGHDPVTLDTERIDRLVERSRREAVSVPIETLVLAD